MGWVDCVFHVESGGYIDVGQNNNTADMAINITEHADSVKPYILSAHIDLGIGQVVVEVSETLDSKH